MRKRWSVGTASGAGALAAALLLGACGDPGSGGEAPAAAPVPGGQVSKGPDGAGRPDSARSGSPAPTSTTRQRIAEKARMKEPKVLYLGDSLAMENQDVLGAQLKRDLGARYRSAPYSGTTLCDYLDGTGKRSLVPDKDKAAALVRAERPDYVVLQFWGNAWGYTPCMDGITYDKAREKYFDRYAADARALAGQINAAAGGADRPRIVWVLQGPDPITPDRVRRVNGIYEAQARASGGLVADAGRAVAPAAARYTWAETLPCTAYEAKNPAYCTEGARGRTALHRSDDPLHFCLAPTTAKSRPCPVRSPGIRRIAAAITRAVGDAS
ncbi:SGNH/GDSL hydrolase family protein [Streptomyces sp. BG9H]|uniref:SGNH/GDSL hydrolase family protein n=1 Tax=Streptomyces anatolicus TaxID=2675858 RepID=A0ABS6YRP6_9ACTN|nr:SGNH/GDSL hydrolase family protein [Streptomyces anatolicus]MBW5424116.1 SGNH/GDSL hydrolase family protein [Streptomyces anatolicus]